ncbi:MAG TPA: hypothetical protein VMV46_11730 [Thermoanaerobaculia bacterium]|nr:hypothetical protein [Thermoanaerobaculia bacterium]
MLLPARRPTEPDARRAVARAPRARAASGDCTPRALASRRVLAAALLAGSLAPGGTAAPLEVATERADAQRVMSTVTPQQLDAALAAGAADAAASWATLIAALEATGPGPERDALAGYLAATGRAAGRRLAAATCGGLIEDQTAELARRLIGDRDRFVHDEGFRAALEPVIHEAMDPASPACLRAGVLGALDDALQSPFDWLERVAVEWGVARRASDARRLADDARSALATQGVGPIRLSLYSLPDGVIAPDDALRFLEAVRAARPERTLLVVAGGANLRALGSRSAALDLVLLDSYARGYSPWPRDALTFLRDAAGRSVLLLRPNQQPGRERDAELGRLLVHSLPDEVDRDLGGLRWTVSPIPFHNGQILETEAATWVSIHTLERRALQLLGREAVPVDELGDPAVLDAYLDAVRRGAAELEDLLAHPVRFVHALPTAGSALERRRAAWALGGGAGYDLDSLLTLLPRPGQPAVALVASLAEGSRLVAGTDDAALTELAVTYRLARDGIRQRIVSSHRRVAAADLETFLDAIARHLAGQGLEVVRLPLILLPAGARTDGAPADFLIGWNNVVVEVAGGARHAEGFASGLAAGDRRARDAFAAAGYALDLLPPLVDSVLANGGYRCASNHDRAP